MKCDDIKRDIDAFVDGELERGREDAVREHLSACEECARLVSERRAFSASLARSFDGAVEGAESSPEARRRLVDRLAGIGRGRSLIVARLAAVVAIGLTIGLVASVFLAPAPDRGVIAARMSEAERKNKQIERLRLEAVKDLAVVKDTVPEVQHPAVRAANVYVRNIGDQLARPGQAPGDVRRLVRETAHENFETQSRARAALRRFDAASLGRLRDAAAREPRYDRFFVPHLIADLEDRARSGKQVKVRVSRVADGRTVVVKQYADGSVWVSVPKRNVRARNMRDLLHRHPQLCREYRISGTDGAVTVGDSTGGVDLKGRLQLHFRTGAFDEEAIGEAYRAWVTGRGGDAREIEKRWREFHDRFRQARRPVRLPQVEVDGDAILREVRKWSDRELRDARSRLENRLKGLDARLEEVQELRSWARALRAYAERLEKEK